MPAMIRKIRKWRISIAIPGRFGNDFAGSGGAIMSKVFSRRRLAALSVAGALSPITLAPLAGRAQTTDQVPPVAPVLPNPFTNLATTPGAAAAPNLGQIDKTKPYFLYFERSIDVLSARHLRDTLVKLAEADVQDITLVLNSPGGIVAPTLHLYNLIRSLPVTIKTYGQDMVASSATILMLAGEQRTADKKTRFWFHGMSGPLITQINTAQFEEQMQMFREQENFFDQIYRERTKIPAADLAKLKHETVTYDADTAIQHGIISAIEPLKVPVKAKLVFFD
jgi:ATP-dependent protease ClpP protease subunit